MRCPCEPNPFAGEETAAQNEAGALTEESARLTEKIGGILYQENPEQINEARCPD